MKMAAPVRIFLLILILIVFSIGVYDMIVNVEKNSCEMTYMYVTPEYLPVKMSSDVEVKFPNYHLHLYAEGQYARKSESLRLTGIPVLFIPGNAGSYRQARSIGSVALKKTQDGKLPYHFNVFTIDYNEEFSGLFGGVLQQQTEFAHECIKHILTLYSSAVTPPKTVLLVGHSMGGMIARALFTLPDFDAALVHTIFTQATPHQAPIMSVDTYMAAFYAKVNQYWVAKHEKSLKDVTVLSTGGGARDYLVRSGLTNMEGLIDPEKSISTTTMTVPRAWASTDHLCHVWCKQIVLATVRAMFDMIGKNTGQIAVNPVYRMGSLQHHFVRSSGSKRYKGDAFDLMKDLDASIRWEQTRKLSWSLIKEKVPKTRYVVMKIPKEGIQDTAFVALTNSPDEAWVGPCSMKGKKENCKQIGNLGHKGNLLPPLYSERKLLHLNHVWMEDFTHMISILPKSTKPVSLMAEMYLLSERFIQYNVTGLLDVIVGFPKSLVSRYHVIRRSKERALFYNISLNGLDNTLQAYKAQIWTRKCVNASTANFAGAVMKFHVPWQMEDTYTFVPVGKNGSHSLKLQTGRPEDFPIDPQLHLYLHPECTYTVAISISWTELFGQFVRMYWPLLPAFLLIQVLMGLSWQLKSMDEAGYAPDFGTSHSNWAQPWRVVPVALGLRLMLYWPEEDAIAGQLGLPRDDRFTMEKELRIFYPALPVLLYLTSYAMMAVSAYIAQLGLCIVGRMLSTCIRGWVMSSRVCNAASWLHMTVYVIAMLIGAQVCGALAINITYVIFIAKALVYYIRAREMKDGDNLYKWSAFHVHVTLSMLLLLLLIFNGPSLIVWAKNIQYSFFLPDDPSRSLGVIVPFTALMLAVGKFPLPYNELYSVSCMVTYFTSVLLLLFCSVSMHRIPYYVGTVLIVLALSAASVRLFPGLQGGPRRQPPQRQIAATPSKDTEDSNDDEPPQLEGGDNQENLDDDDEPTQESVGNHENDVAEPAKEESVDNQENNEEEIIPEEKPKKGTATRRSGRSKKK